MVHSNSQTTFNSDNSDMSSSSGCSGCSGCSDGTDRALCDFDFNEHSVQVVDGVWCEPLERLIGMESLIGLPSGLLLDTQIVAHGFGKGPEVVVGIHAQEGCGIGQLDFERTLKSIPTDAFAPGRSYLWDGVRANRRENKASVIWGT